MKARTAERSARGNQQRRRWPRHLLASASVVSLAAGLVLAGWNARGDFDARQSPAAVSAQNSFRVGQSYWVTTTTPLRMEGYQHVSAVGQEGASPLMGVSYLLRPDQPRVNPSRVPDGSFRAVDFRFVGADGRSGAEGLDLVGDKTVNRVIGNQTALWPRAPKIGDSVRVLEGDVVVAEGKLRQLEGVPSGEGWSLELRSPAPNGALRASVQSSFVNGQPDGLGFSFNDSGFARDFGPVILPGAAVLSS